MYDRNPDYDAGKSPILAESEACANMWVAALKLYFDDCMRCACGAKSEKVEGEVAHRDLFGSQNMLRRLCRPIDANPEAVAQAMQRQVKAKTGRPKTGPKRQRKAKAA